MDADDLILGIVHDVRAHLRKSLSGAQLLDRAAGAGLEPRARQLLDSVIASDRDLERFLGRIADYANAARLSSGKPIPLDAALITAIQQFEPGSVLLQAVPEALLEQMVPREFVRLFAELIDNASKFSRQALVQVRAVLVDDGSSSVEVIDSGIGFDAADVTAMFEPLTRLHSREEYPGFGLGLPICKRIADAAGAAITFTSAPDGGAVARITLP